VFSLRFLSLYTPGDRTPGTSFIGCWVDPKISLEAVENSKNLALLGNEHGPTSAYSKNWDGIRRCRDEFLVEMILDWLYKTKVNCSRKRPHRMKNFYNTRNCYFHSAEFSTLYVRLCEL
jgi:hypothetical protein